MLLKLVLAIQEACEALDEARRVPGPPQLVLYL